jgi:hypothetical protein
LSRESRWTKQNRPPIPKNRVAGTAFSAEVDPSRPQGPRERPRHRKARKRNRCGKLLNQPPVEAGDSYEGVAQPPVPRAPSEEHRHVIHVLAQRWSAGGQRQGGVQAGGPEAVRDLGAAVVVVGEGAEDAAEVVPRGAGLHPHAAQLVEPRQPVLDLLGLLDVRAARAVVVEARAAGVEVVVAAQVLAVEEHHRNAPLGADGEHLVDVDHEHALAQRRTRGAGVDAQRLLGVGVALGEEPRVVGVLHVLQRTRLRVHQGRLVQVVVVLRVRRRGEGAADSHQDAEGERHGVAGASRLGTNLHGSLPSRLSVPVG